MSRHFDAVAPAYDDSLPAHVRAHYRDRRLRAVGALLATGSILDVGCGTGELAEALAARGYAMTGLDDSLGMLRVAAGRGARRLVHGSSVSLPFRSASFDLAMTVATLHHVAEASDVRALLIEMVRVARGGRVLVWDHNPLNPYWPHLMRRLPQDQDGYRLVPLGEIVDGLRAAGARRIEVVRTGWIPEFAPPLLLPLLRAMEAVLERMPGVRALGAHNVVVASRDDVER
jgi:SAM-dependent methyltransferase